MNFAPIRAVADAVLFEGFALYPYRASAIKNRTRWAFGVLAPAAYVAGHAGEASWMQTEFLCVPDAGLEGSDGLVITGELRFLVSRVRRLERRAGAGTGRSDRSGSWEPTARLVSGGEPIVPWEEAEERTVVLEIDVPARRGCAAEGEVALREETVLFDVPASVEVTTLRVDGPSPLVEGRVVRERARVEGRVSIRVEAVPRTGDEPRAVRVRVRVENTSPWGGDRQGFLSGAHLVFGTENGQFVSLLDPPPWAELAASACDNVRLYPVLAGSAGSPAADRLLLASPIILEDHPRIAPESPGDLYDATEIDELLTLRTRALTDEEKREARATDPRVAALVDRAERLPDDDFARLHAVVRAAPATGPATPAPETLRPGARVRVHLRGRRADAQDMFVDGQAATVREVRCDTDGRTSVAVTIDADPATELHLAKHRFFYFFDDEVEPLA
jgi:hypothetical protein